MQIIVRSVAGLPVTAKSDDRPFIQTIDQVELYSYCTIYSMELYYVASHKLSQKKTELSVFSNALAAISECLTHSTKVNHAVKKC